MVKSAKRASFCSFLPLSPSHNHCDYKQHFFWASLSKCLDMIAPIIIITIMMMMMMMMMKEQFMCVSAFPEFPPKLSVCHNFLVPVIHLWLFVNIHLTISEWYTSDYFPNIYPQISIWYISDYLSTAIWHFVTFRYSTFIWYITYDL